ncbi:methyl-accepting chemotaxis protein [Macromonas bipunctata]|uniref:methyl-accepting chemotaxis protein n=1 Tax=Macromonas bipunctata TaxID=183670 RepID=UPI000C33A685|nr:methyl-accepting chemotaxis protein [Macromonas bipunctata]
MSLLDRLSLSRKFVVLGLIALLMAAVPTFLHVQKSVQQIRVAQDEVRGFAPLMALQKVVQFAQQHRGLSSGMLSGNDALRQRRPAVRDNVNQAMNAVDAALARAQAAPELLTTWADLKRQWTTLEQAVAAGQWSAADSTQRHTRLITQLLAFNAELMDAFGLSLDDQMDTYDLMQSTFVHAPWLAEKLGIMRAMGSGFLTRAELPPQSKGTLMGLRDRAQELQREMMTQASHAAHVNPAFQTALGQPLRTVGEQVDKTLQLADQQLINAEVLTYPATQYFDEFTRSIDTVYQFSGAAMVVLEHELDARASGLQRGIALVLALQLAGLLAALWLAWLFVRSITVPIEQAVRVATAVSQGDLTVTCPPHGSNEIGRLMDALSAMQKHLATLVKTVRVDADNVAQASAEIAQGNNDLSARTEQEASALQETAASMEQLNVHVQQNAEHAREANTLAHQASQVATQGGEVVAQVVHTMRDINTASSKIADIIGVIDGIAFQTNILALNAAVEAARAGEQGRGFAVVAGEVRTLAQRSAEAAKEIKQLISDSVSRVHQGTTLVDQAGRTMDDVVGAIQRVTTLMADISTASSAQSVSVAEVDQAVKRMDETTQQNAALVEQSAAAATSLRQQADQLVAAVAVFKT